MANPLGVVAITGGGSGIGLAIAQSLANAGYAVAIGGRTAARLESAAAGYQGELPLLHHELDVTDRESVNKFFDWVESELGPVTILINSAGVNIPNRMMKETSGDDWDRVLAINATGAFNCMSRVLPGMRDCSDGLIINISSISGKRATPLGGVAYDASKFAMTGLGICVANEDGENGIRVTNIYPGEVDTPILEFRPQPMTDAHRAKILQPEDVAPVVLTIVQLPPRAHVPELVIKPTAQAYF